MPIKFSRDASNQLFKYIHTIDIKFNRKFLMNYPEVLYFPAREWLDDIRNLSGHVSFIVAIEMQTCFAIHNLTFPY